MHCGKIHETSIGIPVGFIPNYPCRHLIEELVSAIVVFSLHNEICFDFVFVFHIFDKNKYVPIYTSC